MVSHQSNIDVQGLLEQIKKDLKNLPAGTGYLDLELESAAKHIPAYLKIVKGHIEQLAKVLELETHNHRNLDSVGLAEPVTQLIHLFQALDEEDLQLLEALAAEARAWTSTHAPEHKALDTASLATEA